MYVSSETCNSLTDHEIIIKSREDVAYFTCLIHRYEQKLLQYIQRISSFPEDNARDILQESFLKIWKNIHAIQPGLKPSSWIYRIVHNETISCWRKSVSYKKDRIFSIDLALETAVEQTNDDNYIDEKNMLRAKAGLEKLPAKYKDVLVLKYFEEMSYEEISDVLKIPEGTVAIRLNRAKKILQKELKQLF